MVPENVPDSIPTVRDVNLTKDIASGDKFLNEYKLLSKLGNGHNGKVYLVQSPTDESQYAIKEISKVTKLSITNKDPKAQLNKINNEIDIMKIIRKHPKIVRLYKVLDDKSLNKVFLVLEYCSQGELMFGATHNYTIQRIRSILRDTVLGLEYLHGLGIIHRDIKPSNLLMDSSNCVKISDFGVSLNKKALNNVSKAKTFGTPAFLAPELCNGCTNDKQNDNLDFKVDIWALGITIYCLWFHELPFNGTNEYELFHQITNNTVALPKPQSHEEYQLFDLLAKTLEKDPHKRIDTIELKMHPFLTQDLEQRSSIEFLRFNESYLDPPKLNNNVSRTGSIQRKFKSIFNHRRKSSASAQERPTLSPSLQPKSMEHGKLPPIPSTASLHNGLQRPPMGMSSSSNSLNLNSLLRSKRDVPDYLDGTTYFHVLDSDDDSSSDEDTDDEGNDNDGLYNDEDTLSLRIGPKRGNSALTVRTMNDYLDI